MRRIVLCLAVASATCALTACEPSTKNINIATKTRLYANARLLNLLTGSIASPADAGLTGVSTYIAVQSDIPTAFTTFTPPGITIYVPTAVGSWTAWLSQSESPLASSAPQAATQGQNFTVVVTSNPSGSATPASLQWNLETTPMVPSGQADVRFVLGTSAQAGASVTVGSTSLASSAIVGTLTPWTPVNSSATTLTITSGSTVATFTIPALTAGQLHTYALTADSTAAPILIDILETPGGNGTASAPISPDP